MGAGGPTPRKWTDEERLKVELLTAYGATAEDIATELDTSTTTLYRVFNEERKKGMARANARVAQQLFKMTQSNVDSGPKLGAIVWWEKTRAGLSDRINVNTPDMDVDVNFYMPDNGRGDGMPKEPADEAPEADGAG